MKNLMTLIGAMAVLFLIGCSKEQAHVVPQEKNDVAVATQVRQGDPVTSIEDVEALHLQQTYQLSDQVYNEFMASLVFMEGKFRSALYEDVDAELNDDQSFAFWSNFGVVLDRHVAAGYAYSEMAYASTHEGYRSKGPRDCKQRRKWICLLGSLSYNPDSNPND